MVGFEWDIRKNAVNIEKHRISFEEAVLIFQGPILTVIDDRNDYGEERKKSIGVIDREVIIVVVHTDRNGNIRIISARKANKKEGGHYYDYLKKKA